MLCDEWGIGILFYKLIFDKIPFNFEFNHPDHRIKVINETKEIKFDLDVI